MFAILSDTVANDTLNDLLTGLGFGAEPELDLAIDRFDQWTNPRGTVLATITTGMFLDTDAELARAA